MILPYRGKIVVQLSLGHCWMKTATLSSGHPPSTWRIWRCLGTVVLVISVVTVDLFTLLLLRYMDFSPPIRSGKQKTPQEPEIFGL
jgi:hypothetical protein